MAVGEWDQRQLCPDGGCVGVIGPDGTCKVCGRAAPNWGDERTRGLIAPPEDDQNGEADADDDELAADGGDGDEYEDGGDADDDGDDGDDDDEDEAGGTRGADHLLAMAGDWGTRRLCPDGGCVGVIGPDGHCNVCGKVAA
jgi:hypothetical protein